MPAVDADSNCRTLPGTGIYAMFYSYLVVTVGKPRLTDPHVTKMKYTIDMLFKSYSTSFIIILCL